MISERKKGFPSVTRTKSSSNPSGICTLGNTAFRYSAMWGGPRGFRVIRRSRISLGQSVKKRSTGDGSVSPLSRRDSPTLPHNMNSRSPR